MHENSLIKQAVFEARGFTLQVSNNVLLININTPLLGIGIIMPIIRTLAFFFLIIGTQKHFENFRQVL